MSKTRGFVFGLAIACLIVCFAVLVTRSVAVTTIRESVSASAYAAESDSSAVVQSKRGPVRMVRFILFEEGIFPRELRVEPGLINLAIEDKTNSTSGLVIELAAGGERSRAGEIRRATNHWRGRELIKLTPGRYQVYDASRPSNRAELIVEQ